VRECQLHCLKLLKEDNGVCAVVAKYLTGFERKNLCDQDSIILDWYRFAEAIQIGRIQIWYCLPYGGTWCTDMGDVLNAARTHKLYHLLEALPTRTDSGVARTGGWTFHRTISPAWGAAATLMAGGRTLSLLRGGRGVTTDLIDGVGWRWRWVAVAALGMRCTHCNWRSRLSLSLLA
jgi:hypothetical protein